MRCPCIVNNIDAASPRLKGSGREDEAASRRLIRFCLWGAAAGEQGNAGRYLIFLPVNPKFPFGIK